ncbi:hypothetical protein Tco_0531716 [Tanacetum coccineum]
MLNYMEMMEKDSLLMAIDSNYIMKKKIVMTKGKQSVLPLSARRRSLANDSLKKLSASREATCALLKCGGVPPPYNSIQAAVDQCSVDKNAFEIQIKHLSIDNDQLLKQIMSQEIVHIAMNYVDGFKSQEKDTDIRKLKDRIKSLSGKDSLENVKKDINETETINIELEHSVAKLLSENENLRKEREHLKSVDPFLAKLH